MEEREGWACTRESKSCPSTTYHLLGTSLMVEDRQWPSDDGKGSRATGLRFLLFLFHLSLILCFSYTFSVLCFSFFFPHSFSLLFPRLYSSFFLSPLYPSLFLLLSFFSLSFSIHPSFFLLFLLLYLSHSLFSISLNSIPPAFSLLYLFCLCFSYCLFPLFPLSLLLNSPLFLSISILPSFSLLFLSFPIHPSFSVLFLFSYLSFVTSFTFFCRLFLLSSLLSDPYIFLESKSVFLLLFISYLSICFFFNIFLKIVFQTSFLL